MADQKLVELLLSGVDNWDANPPDLRNAKLCGANLASVDLSNANLRNADVSQAV